MSCCDSEICWECQGTREDYVTGMPCWRCNGLGAIDREEPEANDDDWDPEEYT